MTDAAREQAISRQPLLSDATIVLSAPTQVWSRSTGDIGEASIDGVYHGDTRVLRGMSLTCDGESPEWISTVAAGSSRVTFGGLLRELDDPSPDPRIRILRERIVTDTGLAETISIRSQVAHRTQTRLEIRLTPDFAPLAEVKAGATTPRDAEIFVDQAEDVDSVRARADNLTMTLSAPGASRSLIGHEILLSWVLDIDFRQEVTVSFEVALADTTAVVVGTSEEVAWRAPGVRVDPRANRWTDRALSDLQALRLTLPAEPEDAFFAAGAPWFFTLFGRDSIWAARLLLPVDTRMAASTLRVLARLQGTRTDADTAEQPGKILHELRGEPLAIPGEGLLLPPVYFGTVDATALWVNLLADAWDAGMPEAEIRALLPTLKGCLNWMLHHGDSDGDGFLDYRDETGHGLANQGWKDSGDAIQWRDGALAAGPIALCEVQGYAYEAAIAGARLLEEFAEPGSDELRSWAGVLRERFARSYWVNTPEGRYPAVALDKDKQPVDTLTSNIGHLIGTGILDQADEAHIAKLLTGPTMLTGFGIRTMSSASAGYWPLSYHGGSVWAHDTAIIARGMHKAGLIDEAREVVAELLDAAEGFDYRMPELYAGDPAVETAAPTPYPAACRPQAWSAAAAIVAAEVLSA